tara:strand:- start:6875 stop:6988 length:114 start_codon:yes stop_codon:yes gene_type:complete
VGVFPPPYKGKSSVFVALTALDLKSNAQFWETWFTLS